MHDAGEEHSGSSLHRDDTKYPLHNQLSTMYNQFRNDEIYTNPFRLDYLNGFIADMVGLPKLTDAQKDTMTHEQRMRHRVQRNAVKDLILSAFQGRNEFSDDAPAGGHDATSSVFDNQDRRNFHGAFASKNAFISGYKRRMQRHDYHDDNVYTVEKPQPQPEPEPEPDPRVHVLPTLQDKGFKVVPPKNLVGVQQRARQVPLPNPTVHGLPEWFNEDGIFGPDLIEQLANADNPITVDWAGTPTRIDDKELSDHLEQGEGYLVKHPNKDAYEVLYWENLAAYAQERDGLEAEHRRQEGQDEMREMIGVTPHQPILAGTNHIPNFSLANTVSIDDLDVYHADHPDLMVNWYGTPTRMGDERLQEHLRSGDAMLHAQPLNQMNNSDDDVFHVVHNQQIAGQQTPPALYQQNY